MADAQAQQVIDILRQAPVTDAVRNQAWSAWQSSNTPADFQKNFGPLQMPPEFKERLLGIKSKSAAPAQPPAASNRGQASQPPSGPGFLDRPLIPTPEANPDAAKLPAAGKFAYGAERGLAKVASSLTTPRNLATMGVMAGASAIPVVGPAAAVGAGLYFSYGMAKNLIESIPEARQAWAKKDWQKLGEIVGSDVADAMMLHKAGKGAKEGFKAERGKLERPSVKSPQTPAEEPVPAHERIAAEVLKERPITGPKPKEASGEQPEIRTTPERRAARKKAAEERAKNARPGERLAPEEVYELPTQAAPKELKGGTARQAEGTPTQGVDSVEFGRPYTAEKIPGVPKGSTVVFPEGETPSGQGTLVYVIDEHGTEIPHRLPFRASRQTLAKLVSPGRAPKVTRQLGIEEPGSRPVEEVSPSTRGQRLLPGGTFEPPSGLPPQITGGASPAGLIAGPEAPPRGATGGIQMPGEAGTPLPPELTGAPQVSAVQPPAGLLYPPEIPLGAGGSIRMPGAPIITNPPGQADLSAMPPGVRGTTPETPLLERPDYPMERRWRMAYRYKIPKSAVDSLLHASREQLESGIQQLEGLREKVNAAADNPAKPEAIQTIDRLLAAHREALGSRFRQRPPAVAEPVPAAPDKPTGANPPEPALNTPPQGPPDVPGSKRKARTTPPARDKKESAKPPSGPPPGQPAATGIAPSPTPKAEPKPTTTPARKPASPEGSENLSGIPETELRGDVQNLIDTAQRHGATGIRLRAMDNDGNEAWSLQYDLEDASAGFLAHALSNVRNLRSVKYEFVDNYITKSRGERFFSGTPAPPR